MGRSGCGSCARSKKKGAPCCKRERRAAKGSAVLPKGNARPSSQGEGRALFLPPLAYLALGYLALACLGRQPATASAERAITLSSEPAASRSKSEAVGIDRSTAGISTPGTGRLNR